VKMRRPFRFNVARLARARAELATLTLILARAQHHRQAVILVKTYSTKGNLTMTWKLTNNALLATMAGIILTVFIGIMGYYITRPYIQFEEGQFYKTGNTAVASLRLENKGYFDAEEVIIHAAFTEQITDITSGDAVAPFTVTNGGKGLKSAVGVIPRIVPAQATYIYFAIDNSSGSIGEDTQSFVKQVTFKNGKGSRQPPGWRVVLFAILVAIAANILTTSAVKLFYQSKLLKQNDAMAEKRMERLNKLEIELQDLNGKSKVFYTMWLERLKGDKATFEAERLKLEEDTKPPTDM